MIFDATLLRSPAPVSEVLEQVREAAIRVDDKFYYGKNHFLIMDRLFDELDYVPANEEGRMEDGFVSTTGRFLTRDEAMQMALATRQLTPRAVRQCVDGLDSETLAKAKA